jgi:[protein-PII] uridylyltransferase
MHLQLTEDDRALEPALVWTEETDRGYAGVHVCTWDRAGLFSKLTGGLAAAGLNILTAQIFTRADDIVLDDFYVVDARTGEPPESQVRQRFERIVTDVLARGVDPEKALAKVQKYPPLYRSVGERIPTLVRVDNRISEDFTVVDVEAEDRVGLLFAIAQSLHELGLDVTLAKIVTEKGAAMDTFYVLDGGQNKVTDPDRILCIETRIRDAVASVLGA